uniref:Uncharacterized protein n=1 Tax=Podospora anserina (strain S / ATCC MYA-4624 / DSM 980 / FGSC 10383) TaxID=515849 RepID=A0A090CCJ3_PODAN|nr:Putative protein of unknown function [Podospora anserina S mat+]
MNNGPFLTIYEISLSPDYANSSTLIFYYPIYQLTKMTKPLRQIAAEKLIGPNANPSQLGDPISLKTETNDANSNPRGEPENKQDFSKTESKVPESSGGSHEERMLRGEGPKGHHVSGMMTDEIRQGKRGARGMTMEGDATSVKRVEVVGDATKGGRGKGSKL